MSEHMKDRFPQTATAAAIAEAFSGGTPIENGMPSRVSIDHVFGCPTVTGDLFGARVVHVGIEFTLSNGVLIYDDGDEYEFEERSFVVHDMATIGIHEEA